MPDPGQLDLTPLEDSIFDLEVPGAGATVKDLHPDVQRLLFATLQARIELESARDELNRAMNPDA